MKLTVRQIARTAGVSPASVSRYFSGNEEVGELTASRIEEALSVLGGKAPEKKEAAKTILVLLTHLRFSFYSKTIQELLEQEHSEYTFALLAYDPNAPETVHRFVSHMKPVGVIYFEEEIDTEILKYFQDSHIRTVMCGGAALDKNSDMVHVNDITAAYEGTKYLLDLGHRQILFLSDEVRKIGAGFQRITGSRKAMEEYGLAISEEQVSYGEVTFEAGYSAVRNALRTRVQFTAVFAFSDELAVGAMAALYDEGLSVPENVSVLGYDDLEIASKIRPALTTIHQPIDGFINKTLELFQQPMQGPSAEIMLKHSIVERNSCRSI